jgi:SAM-dependent methyltransferase
LVSPALVPRSVALRLPAQAAAVGIVFRLLIVLGRLGEIMNDKTNSEALFIKAAIKKLCGLDNPADTRIMDFGCGRGHLVSHLLSSGYDAYGRDVKPHWLKNPAVAGHRVKTIGLSPYRLPFDHDMFDVVVSTSVLEHAQNKEEFFREIWRVLGFEGYSIHLCPGRWYLPVEPHMYVPLANILWPKCPRWWFGLWALIGVRKQFQLGKPWKDCSPGPPPPTRSSKRLSDYVTQFSGRNTRT